MAYEELAENLGGFEGFELVRVVREPEATRASVCHGCHGAFEQARALASRWRLVKTRLQSYPGAAHRGSRRLSHSECMRRSG